MMKAMRGSHMVTFAPDYPRNDKGWILFPRDLVDRRKLVPPSIQHDVSLHPAKMSMYLCQEIIKAFTSEGETILDPFAGVGTTMAAALPLDRKCILLELEPHYIKLINDIRVYNRWECIVIQGDNRQILPVPCDHIITSPPYGNDLSSIREEKGLLKERDYKQQDYVRSGLNIGNLNTFYYQQAMIKTYTRMVEGLKPGGTITITHRDRLRGDTRVLYAMNIMKTLADLGCELISWEKWKVPGSVLAEVNRKKGVEPIEDEDILTFRKPL